MTVAFVFTNPRHHLEMMSPVARELELRGVRCRLISLAEFRGFDTPRDDARLQRAIPFNIRSRFGRTPNVSSGSNEHGKVLWSRGEILRRAVWQLLRVRLWQMLRGVSVVVIPNDMVYPYVELLRDLRRRDVKTILMQEGIRFTLPSGYSSLYYGGGGATAICAWGQGSVDYFVENHVPFDSITITGSPRADDLDVSMWRDRGKELLARHEFASAPVAFLSNPIEIAGFGTKQQKLDLFARFLEEIAPTAVAQGIPIVVKNHVHEDPADFARIAARSPMARLVKVLDSEPTFAVIAAARAAIVLTSTVGLEALMFGVPIAQLEIPGYGLAFEYVARGAAIPLRVGAIRHGFEELLQSPSNPAGRAFVDRHLHDRGRARHNVADVIERVLRT